MIVGSFADLCVADVVASAAFYQQLLGLEVVMDHGWYLELGASGRVVLALVQAGHPTVPAEAGTPPRGLLLSFETDDAAAAAEVARSMGCRFVVGPERQLGQDHFMVLDPDGVVVDVMERIELTAQDRRLLVGYRREAARRG